MVTAAVIPLVPTRTEPMLAFPRWPSFLPGYNLVTHWLAYQIVFIASFGFLFWFFLMKIYPASGVASFSFLSPVFAVVLGWVILGEEISASIWLALGLVAVGLVLINRK